MNVYVMQVLIFHGMQLRWYGMGGLGSVQSWGHLKPERTAHSAAMTANYPLARPCSVASICLSTTVPPR